MLTKCLRARKPRTKASTLIISFKISLYFCRSLKPRKIACIFMAALFRRSSIELFRVLTKDRNIGKSHFGQFY